MSKAFPTEPSSVAKEHVISPILNQNRTKTGSVDSTSRASYKPFILISFRPKFLRWFLFLVLQASLPSCFKFISTSFHTHLTKLLLSRHGRPALWYHHPEILNFWTRGPEYLICSGPHKSYSPLCAWPSFIKANDQSSVFIMLHLSAACSRSITPSFFIFPCFHGALLSGVSFYLTGPASLVSVALSPYFHDFRYWVYFLL